MAYPNPTTLGLTQQSWKVHGSDPATFTMVNGTGNQIDNINDPWDSPDDSTYLWTNGSTGTEIWFLPDWDAQPKRYQIIMCCVRVKSNGTGTCELRLYGGGGDFRGGTNGISFDVSAYTTWTNLIFPARIYAGEMTNPNTNSKDYIDPSSVLHRWRANTSGGGEVYISNHAWFIMPVAHHDFLEVNGDGSTTDWTRAGGQSTDWQTAAYNFASQDVTQSGDWDSTSPMNNKSVYLYPTATNQEQHFALETPPKYAPDDGDWDFFDIVIFMMNEDASTGNLNEIADVNLYESGAIIDEFHPDVIEAEQLLVDADQHNTSTVCFYRFNTRRFKTGKPVSWANVELRIKYTGSLASTEDPKLYGIALAGPFGYSPPIDAASADSFSVNDAATKVFGTFANASDSMSIQEATAEVVTIIAAALDTMTFNDLTSGRGDYLSNATDSMNFDEVVSSLAAMIAASSDSLNFDEAATAIRTVIAAALDTFTLDDTSSVLAGYVASSSDSISVDDAVTARADYIASVLDSLTIDDVAGALVAYIATSTDSVTLDEIATAAAGRLASASDSLNFDDVATSVRVILAAAIDSLSIDDSASVLAGYVGSSADSLTFDEIVQSIGAYIGASADSMTFDEVVSTVAAYIAASSDSLDVDEVASAVGAYLATGSESFDLSEAVTGIRGLFAVAADSFSLNDSAEFPVVGTTLLAVVRNDASLSASVDADASLLAQQDIDASLSASVDVN